MTTSRIDAPTAPDAAEFRAVMRSFPSPVTIVTALDAQGRPHGLTCSAICSLSDSPPAMLACVNKHSSTLRAIRANCGFAVNLLGADQQAVAKLFASRSHQKFSKIPWNPAPRSARPRLTSAPLAFVDCDLLDEIDAGTHMILIGRVTSCYGTAPQPSPLIHLQGTYTRPELST